MLSCLHKSYSFAKRSADDLERNVRSNVEIEYQTLKNIHLKLERSRSKKGKKRMFVSLPPGLINVSPLVQIMYGRIW